MRIPFSFIGGSIGPVTIPSNWSSVTCSSATTCICSSATKTLTIPAGNTGTLKFSSDGAVGMKYSKNAGTFTTVSESGTATFSNADTLALQITGLTPQDTFTITVTDNMTAATIGTFNGTNTHV